jgi:hypothetical protein
MEEESHECESKSCLTDLELDSNSVLVNANYTSFVGINLISKPKCVCKYDQILHKNDVTIDYCSHSSKCTNNALNCEKSFKCVCREGSDGKRCDETTRSFNGQGFVWLSPLMQCSESHISIEIMTQIPDGLILYFGPIIHTSYHELQHIKDFISLELKDGNISKNSNNIKINIINIIIIINVRICSNANRVWFGNSRVDSEFW